MFGKMLHKVKVILRWISIWITRIVKFITLDIWRMDHNDFKKGTGRLVKDLKVILLTLNTFSSQKIGFQATALSYQTTMSIVPFLAIAIYLTSGIGLSDKLSAFLYANISNERLIQSLVKAADTIYVLGDLFFLKIQCENPLMFILTCMISSIVYSLIIYSLTITFSVIGKALAVIILILQVAGSGGTFPIELLPAPFKALAPFLPFRYGINALRETVAGMDWQAYFKDIGLLLLFIIPALILGLLLRKPCIKIIAFFNEKVEESDLVI